VLRLLRGEHLETLSRELGVTAAALSGWREQLLEGGAANLKAREADVDNEETQRLKSLVADLSMSNELVREKIHRMEAGRPLVEPLGFGLCYPAPDLPQKGVNKQSATHADATVNAPYRQLDPRLLEGLPPRQDVLVNTVYQRAVQIE
jgi:transposase-like protein